MRDPLPNARPRLYRRERVARHPIVTNRTGSVRPDLMTTKGAVLESSHSRGWAASGPGRSRRALANAPEPTDAHPILSVWSARRNVLIRRQTTASGVCIGGKERRGICRRPHCSHTRRRKVSVLLATAPAAALLVPFYEDGAVGTSGRLGRCGPVGTVKASRCQKVVGALHLRIRLSNFSTRKNRRRQPPFIEGNSSATHPGEETVGRSGCSATKPSNARAEDIFASKQLESMEVPVEEHRKRAPAKEMQHQVIEALTAGADDRASGAGLLVLPGSARRHRSRPMPCSPESFHERSEVRAESSATAPRR